MIQNLHKCTKLQDIINFRVLSCYTYDTDEPYLAYHKNPIMSSTKGMSKVKKAMKVILIILLIIAVLAVLLWFGLKKIWNNIMTAQMAPDNYTSEVKTGGELEA